MYMKSTENITPTIEIARHIVIAELSTLECDTFDPAMVPVTVDTVATDGDGELDDDEIDAFVDVAFNMRRQRKIIR